MAGPGFASGYDRAATGAAAREEAAAAAVLMSSALTARDACFYLKKPLADLGVTAKMVEESYTVKGKHHPNGGINADVAALFADRAPPGAVLCLESGHLRTVKVRQQQHISAAASCYFLNCAALVCCPSLAPALWCAHALTCPADPTPPGPSPHRRLCPRCAKTATQSSLSATTPTTSSQPSALQRGASAPCLACMEAALDSCWSLNAPMRMPKTR